MEQPIILISGGTGVGTSRIATELANKIHIYSVVSTDSIREILRCLIHPGLNPTLQQSTYLAGQSENYKEKGEDLQQEKIIRAFKTQVQAVAVGIQGIIERSPKENSPVIIEGIHIIPRKYPDTINKHILQYFIDIPDKSVHRSRFELRATQSPYRKLQHYLENFTEIRWIQDYLRRKAQEAQDTVIIENQGSLDGSVDACMRVYFKRFHP
ncbi:MAG: hypothetical protein AABX52_00965 [Nanoarchaeota archaeon]